MDWKTAATLLVTVAVALSGYVYSMHLVQRNARLDRKNRQLSDLYGPLMALDSAGSSSWQEFRQYCRPNVAFWADPPPSAEEMEEWRRWMTHVFMPLNRRMRDVVVTHADLLDESEFPDCLLDLCAHVSSYESILARWERDDYIKNRTDIPFPRDALRTYVTSSFARLKADQSALLGTRTPTSGRKMAGSRT